MGLFVVAIVMDYYDGFGNYTFMMALLEMDFDETLHLARAAEEYFEMIGSVMILIAFLEYGHSLPAGKYGLRLCIFP